MRKHGFPSKQSINRYRRHVKYPWNNVQIFTEELNAKITVVRNMYLNISYYSIYLIFYRWSELKSVWWDIVIIKMIIKYNDIKIKRIVLG